MKRFIFLLVVFLLFEKGFTQTVITSDANIASLVDNSAELKVYTSTNKGVLIPRLTSLQMYSVSNPDSSLLIYNTSDKDFEFFNPTAHSWDRIGKTPSSSVAPTRIFEGEIYFNTTDKKLYFNNGSSWVSITNNGTAL